MRSSVQYELSSVGQRDRAVFGVIICASALCKSRADGHIVQTCSAASTGTHLSGRVGAHPVQTAHD